MVHGSNPETYCVRAFQDELLLLLLPLLPFPGAFFSGLLLPLLGKSGAAD
jgi:hypothetical protein